LRKLFGRSLLAMALALALASCTGGKSPAQTPETADEHFFNNFKTAAASAGKDGYTPYWLGREFTAGGFVYSGPYLGDLPGERFDRGGMSVTYSPDSQRGGGSLDLLLYSRAAWEEDRSRQDGAATKYVTVAGQSAKLFVLSAGTRPVNQLRLLLTFGDTTVLAIAYSGGAVTPGRPDVSPLIDEQTFLNVMQNLRPYPR
jgi:hypothetical protein